MKLWTCTTCGNAEYLTFYPDACSVCGGAMDNQDGRSTLSADEVDMLHCDAIEGMFAEDLGRYEQDGSWIQDAIADFEREMDEASLEPCSVIRLWHCGQPLSAQQQDVIDMALAANRVDMLVRVHDRAA